MECGHCATIGPGGRRKVSLRFFLNVHFQPVVAPCRPGGLFLSMLPQSDNNLKRMSMSGFSFGLVRGDDDDLAYRNHVRDRFRSLLCSKQDETTHINA